VTGSTHRVALRRSTPLALAALSAGCLAALMTGPASAATAQSVINASLNDVSCTSTTSCMAVGWFLGQIPGTSGFQDFPLAEQWNGSTWTVLPAPATKHPGGGELLSAVSCPSSTSCMAVGQVQVESAGGFTTLHPFAESWNGTTWRIVPTPTLTHSGASLTGVACTATTACMAVGNEGPPRNPTMFTLAEQWDGTAWHVVTTPSPLTPGGTSLATVSCPGPASCMAVGYYGFNNGTGTSVTLAEQWNGTTWRQRTTPTPDRSADLGGVACTTATACLAVGAHFMPTGNLVNATLAEQWNGSRWTVQPSPNPSGAGAAGLGRVSCTSPSSCMAVGGAVDETGEVGFNVAEAWNGTSWHLLRTPNPGSTSNELRGVSCTSPSSCMAVGDFAGIGNELTLAEQWNGTKWSVVKTPRP
jgi:hypothetical protein